MRDDFRYVVPDFRLNKQFEQLNILTQLQKDKVEFLAMNVAGSVVRTGRLAMKPSVAKILEKSVLSITVWRRSLNGAIVFQKQ